MQSQIIFSTLVSSGISYLSCLDGFVEAVIIDECCQCIEIETLIPLKYSPKRVILIGDPRQLPATTFSKDSERTKFNRSLFERILQNDILPNFLDLQYRMQPNLSKFSSTEFYCGRLKDSKQIKERYFPIGLAKFSSRNMFFFDLTFT